MIKEISYSSDEKLQIKIKIKDESFCSSSWSDDDISNIKDKIKEHYLSTQKYQCPYCKQTIKSKHGRYWDIEHIIPRSYAPSFIFEPFNLCMSCVDCNSAKSDKKVTNSKAKVTYPKLSSAYLIIHPHFDKYSDNILVIKEGLYYVAKTKKGEKTIETCKLNRFYEFSNFDSSIQEDETIFLLSTQLKLETDKKIRNKITCKIAELAIKGSLSS
ncbi:HNH endonuclease [Photobacterium phosphoreum]|uniref:HNH endonuclease n=1 Tax=Photobacterium phosphoreum TaxID=659 RepID=UPI000D1A1E2E|nr:HNH endonuclease [Photobacterium phosphoreum]PSW17381.1 HNH endonuclease [Photobacterium phosphoreum]